MLSDKIFMTTVTKITAKLANSKADPLVNCGVLVVPVGLVFVLGLVFGLVFGLVLGLVPVLGWVVDALRAEKILTVL
jgi:hypothetical protein